MPTTAVQLPWVGKALNWHGQPYAQLQLANSRPWMVHLTSVMASSQSGMAKSGCRQQQAEPSLPYRACDDDAALAGRPGDCSRSGNQRAFGFAARRFDPPKTLF